MEERKTRFDNIVKKEEKSSENVFEKSNRTLKSPQINEPDGENDKDGSAGSDSGEEAESSKKTSGKTGAAKAEDRDIVSRRLNISDITDAAAQKGKKKGGRSRTFYMQDAMYEKLASAAEKNGIKPSQLLHIILENVLDKM